MSTSVTTRALPADAGRVRLEGRCAVQLSYGRPLPLPYPAIAILREKQPSPRDHRTCTTTRNSAGFVDHPVERLGIDLLIRLECRESHPERLTRMGCRVRNSSASWFAAPSLIGRLLGSPLNNVMIGSLAPSPTP